MKKVIVASENPVKILATKHGFEKMFPNDVFTFRGVSVSSGVSDQPMSDTETYEGAKNRAQEVFKSFPDADYWVGIEGGITYLEDDMATFAWIVIKSKELEAKGKTGMFLLPPKVAELVKQGKELGEADDIVFGLTNSKQKNGAIGLLSGNIRNRTSFYTEAVICALIPFKNMSLYVPTKPEVKLDSYLFTSESVSEGHPDKLCDQISDAVLDAILKKDPDARVAVECLAKTGFVVIAGEVTTSAYVDIQSIARKTINKIGYDNPDCGFDGNTCGILVSISEQSPDIAQGVDEDSGLNKEQGAGDQGLMFGYATNETKEFMPLPIITAHKLTKRLADLRKAKQISYLRPDAKSQVTVEYVNGKPKRIHTVVISTQHDPGVSLDTIQTDMIEKVIKPVCGNLVDSQTIYHINLTGTFVIGGPVGDAGLTGRKIIVDTYGGQGSHGGGAFSGKDPSKVDRSASYYGRYVAKNIVASGLADKCEVQVAYAIGVADPVSILVDTFGTGKKSDREIAFLVKKYFNFRPKHIIEHLGLKRPIYQETAAYGHFGRSQFSWEKLDMVEKLRLEI